MFFLYISTPTSVSDQRPREKVATRVILSLARKKKGYCFVIFDDEGTLSLIKFLVLKACLL